MSNNSDPEMIPASQFISLLMEQEIEGLGINQLVALYGALERIFGKQTLQECIRRAYEQRALKSNAERL